MVPLAKIGFLAFPLVQQLDLTGPYKVLASLAGAEMHMIRKTLEPVASSTGLILAPNVTLASCPQLDLPCMPGGVGVNAL